MKSLRDILLEQTVFSFSKIFSEKSQAKSFKVKEESLSGIYLPRGLFDNILMKSKEMCWRILPEELLPCVLNLKKLQWKNLSYFTERVVLRPENVRFICEQIPTMKSLSVHIMYSDVREISECLSSVVGSLENLDLTLTRECKERNVQEMCECFSRFIGSFENLDFICKCKERNVQEMCECLSSFVRFLKSMNLNYICKCKGRNVQEMCECFSSFARSFENLDLNFICKCKERNVQEMCECLSSIVRFLNFVNLNSICKCKKQNTNEVPPEYFKGLPRFRLKRLSFNQKLEMLPLNIDPDSLERLDLREAPFTTNTLKVIESFNNLRHLNLGHVCKRKEYWSILIEIMDAVRKENKEIRSLEEFTSKKYDDKMSDLVKDMNCYITPCYPNISKCEIWRTGLQTKTTFRAFLGSCFITQKLIKNCEDIDMESQNYVRELLSLPERELLKYEAESITIHLLDNMLINEDWIDPRKVEEMLIKCLDYEIGLIGLERLWTALISIDMNKFSADFKMKFISRMCSLAPIGDVALDRCTKLSSNKYDQLDIQKLNDFMLDFIEKNPHKQLAKKISESFELYPQTFEGKKQVVLIMEHSLNLGEEFELLSW